MMTNKEVKEGENPMNIILKRIEVRFASYYHGIPENRWAFAPVRPRSKTIRQIIDETITEVRSGAFKKAEFGRAIRFVYKVNGRDIYIDYDDGDINLYCRDPEYRVLAKDEYEDTALDRTLDETFQRHVCMIEQYAEQVSENRLPNVARSMHRNHSIRSMTNDDE